MHTVIIGAGPAGLTAAYELSKLGVDSTVLEADTTLGGLSRTVVHRGYRFDIGGHRFFSKVPQVNQLWEEILGEEFLLRPRVSRILYRNHFFDYPLRPLNALAGLGPVEAARCMLSFAKAQVAPVRDERSFQDWVSNRFGRRLFDIFFRTYTEKVWGMPCTEISADWAAQRIKNLSLFGALKNAVFGQGQRDGEVITTLIEQFHYPRLGPGMMWERCAEHVQAGRGRIVTGTPVERIRHRGGRVEAIVGRSASGEAVEFAGDRFISSMPIRELIRAFDPAPPDHVRRAAELLRYRDYLTVVLIVNRPHVFEDNWIYIHSPEAKMGRVQNYKNWSPAMVPDPSRTSLGLEYFLWDRDEEWDWSDERLIELGIRDCEAVRLAERREIEDGTVVRMRKAYPVYDQVYQAALASIRGWLATAAPNLECVGRNGQHRYNNQDHSMMTGVYAARNVIGERHDVWAVNVEQEYHEEVRIPVERSVPVRIAVEEAKSVRRLSDVA